MNKNEIDKTATSITTTNANTTKETNITYTTDKSLFTPIFIIIALCIFIVGIIGVQMLDKLFLGSPNLNAIRLFGITIILNIIIFIFIIMSFSKVKFAVGNSGPQGNKGSQGLYGIDGGINTCVPKYQTVQDKKAFEHSINYLDTKPPLIETT